MSLIERIVLKPLGDDPPKARLLYGQDVRDSLRLLDDESVQVVCTSPPYWGLRDYGGEATLWGGDVICDHEWGPVGPDHHPGQVEQTKWKGAEAAGKGQTAGSGQFCGKCGGWLGQLGLEPTPQLFVEHLVEIFDEIRRVLRPDGVVWLNLGDSYAGYHGNSKVPDDEAPSNKPGYVENMRSSTVGVGGLKAKDLVGVPWRAALALQDAGWWLRNDIVWSKGNPMPESVTDRCTRSHEYIFLLTKQSSYFFDTFAIKEGTTRDRVLSEWEARRKTEPARKGDPGKSGHVNSTDTLASSPGRNKRTIWQVNSKPYPGAHFAVWPEELVEPMIKAGSSEYGCCSKCRAPYKRRLEVTGVVQTKWGKNKQATRDARLATMTGGMKNDMGATQKVRETVGWDATCDCDADVIPCLVMDTFSGSATTGAVAMRLGRDYVGTDLQPDYIDLAAARLEGRKAPQKTSADDEEPDLIGDLFGG